MWARFRYEEAMFIPRGQRSHNRWLGVPLAACVLLGAVVGCERKKEQGARPPLTKPPPGVCEGASAAPVEGLVGQANGFCIDPRSDVRRYGAFSDIPLDAVCTELFNGECELYKSYGLEGVKTLRYLAADGSPRSINVVVSLFHRSSGAFGFYTRRILGSDLPARATVHALKNVAGRGSTGVGVTYLWRGKQVVELTYVSEDETPTEIERNSPQVLHPLTSAISETLLGPTDPSRDVLMLETEELDEQGVKVEKDVMGVVGAGESAVGYYSRPDTPHRLLIAERRDETGVRDLVSLLQRAGGYKKLKGRDIYVLRMTAEERAPETWYARREGNLLLGVGPLELPSAPIHSTPKERKEKSSQWEAFAIRRLMAFSAHARAFPQGDQAK